MELIRPFVKLGKKDGFIAGGKGASLGEMTQAGIPVPEGFVILSDAFECFIKKTDLNVEIDSILHKVNHEEVHTVENASEEIKALIMQAEMPKEIEKTIIENHKQLKAEYVAVRSSATAEDSSTAAWAGQLDSYLNTTERDLIENVKKCWASLFTPRAIVYKFEKNLHKEKISVAVVIQKMINSEESGIAFSVHPVTQDYNQIIIEAGFGLGEAIVSGQITPDSYVIEKEPRRIIDKNIAEQTNGLFRKEGGGNEWQEIGEKGKQQVLIDKEILELSELILKIEKHYGFPCDIEWAREKGKFYIVQSRPITTLTDKKKDGNIHKIKLKELVHLDVPLSLVELHYEQECAKKLPWAGEEFTFKPYIVYMKKDNSVFFYYDAAGVEWQITQAGTYKKELEAINTIKKGYNKIKDIIEKEKVLSRKELMEFIKSVRDLWPWLNYMWWAIEYRDKHKLPMDNLIQIRKYTEHFSPGIIHILRDSIKKIYPKLKDYSDFILLSEIEGNNIPDETVLKQRINYIFTENKLYNSIEEIKGYNFIFEQNSNADNLSGQTAYPGKVTGRVRIIEKRKDALIFKEGEILVASTTTPDYLPAMKKSAAIISEHGGAISHAAIISRELKIPCIVGVKEATKKLKAGDLVEVDADNGIVKILEAARDNNYQIKWIKEGEVKIEEDKYLFLLNSLLLDPVISKVEKRTGISEGVASFLDMQDKSNKIFVSQDDKRGQWGYNFFLDKKRFNDYLIEIDKVYTIAKKFRDKIENINFDNISLNQAREIFTKEVSNLLSAKVLTYFTIHPYSWKIEETLQSELLNTVPEDNIGEVMGILMLQEGRDGIEQERHDWLKNIILPSIASKIGKSNVEENKVLMKKVETHLKEYGSYPAGFNTEPWDINHFNELFKIDCEKTFDSLNDELIKLKEKAKINNSKKKEIISKYKIEENLVKNSNILGKLAEIRFDLRIKAWSYYLYVFRKLLDFCSKKSGLSKRELGLIEYNELLELLKGRLKVSNELKNKIKERIGVDSLSISYGGEHTVIFGEKAKNRFYTEIEPKKDIKNLKAFGGEIACKKGVVKGRVFKFVYGSPDYVDRIKLFPENEILVANLTMPVLLPAIRKAKAIVTDGGGITCHAAIVSRELGIPCIIGTDIATKLLQDGDLIEVDTEKGIVTLLESKDEIDISKYNFLEEVPGGYPLDVAHLNLAHLMAPKVREFNLDAGSMILIFENGNYSLFIEKDKWFNTGKKILEYTLEKDERVKKWREKMKKWLADIPNLTNSFIRLNETALSNDALYDKLEEILEVENRNGIEDADFVTGNYGTNIIQNKLTDTLKELGYDINKTTQIILRATGIFPIIEYEKEIGQIALSCHKQKIESVKNNLLKKDKLLNNKLEEIISKYGWLDASIVNPPKSIDSLIKDINDLLSFGDELERILKEREQDRQAKKVEKDSLLKGILSKATREQKRAIVFSVESAELGRILVDKIMEFIYIRRKIYREIASRLSLSEIEIKFLSPKEIKDCLANKFKIESKEIKKRQKLALCILKDSEIRYVYEEKAEKLKESLFMHKSKDESPLRGEIAFSKGKVIGTAKIVRNNSEMYKVQKGDILVSSRTYPDLLPAMKKSSAILAELGGLLSHAAIVSRELHIPCIVGVKNATAKIKDGDILEIDTDKGTIKILEKTD